MAKYVIELVPLGARLEAERGSALEDLLPEYGLEFPCGGAGTCRGCRIRILEGNVPVTPEMAAAFTGAELSDGWRLACRSRVEGPLKLEVAQWEGPILGDDSAVPFEPALGAGIVVDLGTTTLVAQMLDLATGKVLAVQTALNPQAAHGADVMSRIRFAIHGGAGELRAVIREAVGRMIQAMPRLGDVRLVLLAGNTVMHHLFCGVSVKPLAHAPFETPDPGEKRFGPAELGWELPEQAEVRFLPCIGGFVGSDVLAGVLATRIHESPRLAALIDLGTNGEIVLGGSSGLLCASTAAGPAFEGGRIRMGMRAAPGAIAHVAVRDGGLECHVIGGGAPRGICGSGLVDAAAAGLETGSILANGRLSGGAREWPLTGTVALAQSDIRELQLAKGAIAAGLHLLAARRGARVSEIHSIYLAGAFGNYLDAASARRIRLLPRDAAGIEPSGNTALRGLKMALLAPSRRDGWIREIAARMEHVALASDATFQETFVECLAF